MTAIEHSLDGSSLPSCAHLTTILDGDDLYSDHIDPRTGEIFTDRCYKHWPWKHYPDEDEFLFFEDLTSLNQRDLFMEKVDRRKLVSFNSCRYHFNLDRGSSSLDNRNPFFTKTAFRNMDKLVRNLDYKNYLYTTANILAKKLDVHPKSVTRQLRSLGSLVRVRSAQDGMRRGVLQIAVSPAYGYKMEPKSINKSRYIACCDWYRPTAMARFRDRFELINSSSLQNYPDGDEIAL